MTRLNRFLVLLVFSCLSFDALAIDPVDTRLLTQPAISANHIAFVYAGDLWVANKDGSNIKRLTVGKGTEFAPAFSPDGKTIAFSGEYDGNTDIYTIPVEGGNPVRLTWHPYGDVVRGFTPDGKNILFTSQRSSFTGRLQNLFTVPVNGGQATKVEIPHASWASFSPDGKKIAYNPYNDNFRQWKHYRGGGISSIWIYDFASKQTTKISQSSGGCNDVNPIWIGNNIYFRSDRNGEFNLFAYNTTTQKVDALTSFTDYPVLNAAGNGNTILFEQAGYLHLYTAGQSSTKKLTIGVSADIPELRTRFVSNPQHVRSAGISPSGQRAVFDYRGEIVTVPAEKGDPRNLTQTTGAHERFPDWSPDGKSIAYISDASGENQLYIHSQDGKGEPKKFALKGTGFYAFLKWSPDSKKISFVDNGRNLYVFDVASVATKKIDADELYVPGPYRNLFSDWSNDSKWISYTKVTETQFKRAYLYSIDQQKSFPLTDGLSDVSDPVFDRTGKYIFFFASTDAGPVINWFDQSNNDMRSTQSIYLVTLQKETISPFAKESDEEKLAAEADTSSAKKKDGGAEKKTSGLTIDWEGIEHRIIDIPVKAGNYRQLGVGSNNELFYLESLPGPQGPASLYKFDLKSRTAEEITQAFGYSLSADGSKMLVGSMSSPQIVNAGEKPNPSKAPLNLSAVEVKIDPGAEWKNIFDEGWRVNRDYFYDPGMHGADWAAIKKKYEIFLPHVTSRAELNKVMQWMFSELSVGHHFIFGGEPFAEVKQVDGGLLGADYIIDKNRYRIQKIYGGLNWNPSLRSPLTEPGVNAKEGEYIMAVNGKDLLGTDDIYRLFENTTGKIVELTLSSKPEYTGSRIVKVVPVSEEFSLRNRDWVEGNLKKVTEATKGQVAYVYVPNTAYEGFEYFKRYFFPQANRKAIIIDERFNGGGQLADYYIDILRRPHQAHWNFRYGKDLKSPSASIQGPKVMIVNESAGSGGDMLPWMFRKFGVGTIVGTRTWGGLVGILGFPEFIDGGEVTAPNLAIWTNEGFIVENEGVAPDIEVEQDPGELAKGRDPQLEKAIEVALKELEKNPPPVYKRPAYPKKVK